MIPSSYSVRKYFWNYHGLQYGSHCLVSWVEVSNDGTQNSWTEIDCRENSDDLRGKSQTVNFTIPHIPRIEFRFIRLRLTGKNTWGKTVLCLDSLEIFGSLLRHRPKDTTRVCQAEFVCDELKKRAPPRQTREFPYDESKKLDGVIAYLTRECGGNVHSKGVVNVTVSSNTECVKNVADFGANSYFLSKDEQNSWVCYDFKERRVIPTSYSVRSLTWAPYGQNWGSYHPRSWVIEVSNDQSSWTEIDRRDNNDDLKFEYEAANFKISRAPSNSFRFFRFRHTGSQSLVLSLLEVFGSLF